MLHHAQRNTSWLAQKIILHAAIRYGFHTSQDVTKITAMPTQTPKQVSVVKNTLYWIFTGQLAKIGFCVLLGFVGSKMSNQICVSNYTTLHFKTLIYIILYSEIAESVLQTNITDGNGISSVYSNQTKLNAEMVKNIQSLVLGVCLPAIMVLTLLGIVSYIHHFNLR